MTEAGAELSLRGEMAWRRGGAALADPTPFPPPPSPNLPLGAKSLSLILSDFLINSLLYHAYRLHLLRR